MTIQSWDALIARIGTGHTALVPFWGEQTGTTSVCYSWSVHNMSAHKLGDIAATPVLPAGVTNYIPSTIQLISTSADASILVGWFIKLGSLNLATNAYTDSAAMPTMTELGVSRAIPSHPITVINTTLGGTAGTIHIHYNDQDGNADTSSADSLTNAAVAKSADWLYIQNKVDSGIIDITDAGNAGGSSPTGIVDFYGCIPFAIVPHVGLATPVVLNLLGANPSIHHLPAAATIGFIYFNSSAKAISGNVFFIGDSA